MVEPSRDIFNSEQQETEENREIFGKVHCEHANWKPRRRVISGGMKRVFLQCLDCGHARALKMVDYPNHDELEPYDDDLSRRIWDQHSQVMAEKIEARREAENREWWDKYTAYLQTPAWKQRRAKVFKRAGNMCEACLVQPAWQVHHTTYKHVGNEPLFELRAVCEDCHETITAMDRGEYKPL